MCVYFVYVYLCSCVYVNAYVCAFVCMCVHVCVYFLCLYVYLVNAINFRENSKRNMIRGMKFEKALGENEGGKHPVNRICESSTRNPIRGMKFTKALGENEGENIYEHFVNRV